MDGDDLGPEQDPTPLRLDLLNNSKVVTKARRYAQAQGNYERRQADLEQRPKNSIVKLAFVALTPIRESWVGTLGGNFGNALITEGFRDYVPAEDPRYVALYALAQRITREAPID